jgi:hypothetical protein
MDPLCHIVPQKEFEGSDLRASTGADVKKTKPSKIRSPQIKLRGV